MPLDLPPIHSFPPFFTRQPNAETFSSQRLQWSSLILAHYRADRRFRLLLTNDALLSSPLFTNSAISRSLKLDTLKEIIDHMVLEGQAEYVSKKKDEVLIYWRRPEDWAALLTRHVDRTGQNHSVLTMYELTESDEARHTEFWEMDRVMLRKVVEVMAKKGKAVIMKGSDGEELGVKFL